MLAKLAPRVGWKQFFKELVHEISEDHVTNGAAALAYYFFLAVFPAMIALLSFLPFVESLGFADIDQSILELMNQALPVEASQLFAGTVREITTQPRGGLLSFGLVVTLWAASNGMYATMQQLNITYGVKEGRPFWKSRGIAVLLTIGFGLLTVAAFALGVGGGWLQELLGGGAVVQALFWVARWAVIATAMLLALALVYKFGPDVEQKFRFITLGSVFGVVTLTLASVAIRAYVDNFGKFNATYGSLGAVIVFMLWLNVLGLVVLLGSEINALVEQGEKRVPRVAA